MSHEYEAYSARNIVNNFVVSLYGDVQLDIVKNWFSVIGQWYSIKKQTNLQKKISD